MNILFLLLQAQGGAPQGGGSGTLIWMIVFFVVIWFLMMRPQQKKAKEERKFRDSLTKGTKVMFSGGIHGEVASVDTTTVDIKVGNGVILTVEKSMVQPDAKGEAPVNDKKETKEEKEPVKEQKEVVKEQKEIVKEQRN